MKLRFFFIRNYSNVMHYLYLKPNKKKLLLVAIKYEKLFISIVNLRIKYLILYKILSDMKLFILLSI